MIAMMQIGIHGTRRRRERPGSRAIHASAGIAGLRVSDAGLGEADAGIDIGVKDVHEQVDAEDQDRLQDDDGL